MTFDVTVDPGMEVFTRDHHRLGTVKDVRANHFKVHARFSRDYWLRARNVLIQDGNRLVMEFARRDSGIFKDREPAAA